MPPHTESIDKIFNRVVNVSDLNLNSLLGELDIQSKQTNKYTEPFIS